MTRDLEQTVKDLQNTAIGNCRKRIEEAAHKPKIPPDGDHNGNVPCCERKTPRGVTSLLKDKYGL